MEAIITGSQVTQLVVFIMSSLLGSDPHKVRKEVEFPYRVLHALSQAAAPLSDLALPTQLSHEKEAVLRDWALGTQWLGLNQHLR